MPLALLLAMVQAPMEPTPEWRVAAFGRGVVVYVDQASVARTGDEVRFRLQQRRPEPADADRALHAVTANCMTGNWRSVYSWTYRENGRTLRAEETLAIETRAGSVYGAALAKVCEDVLGTPGPDIDQHAADYFNAPVSPR